MSFQIADPAGLGCGRLDPRLKHLSRLTPTHPSQELTPDEERAREQRSLNGLLRFLIHRDRVKQIEEHLIPVEGRDIPVRIYKPDAPSPMPLLVYLHGGGWVLGGLRQADAVCRRLAKRGKCIVISVDYRLAPEHKFPAGLEDTLAVLDWAFERAINFGGDFARLGVAGGSAGGTLAAAACLTARQRGTPPIRFQILFNPVMNLAQMDTDSHRQYGTQGYGITTPMLEKRRDQYLSTREEQLDQRVSPLLAKDLRNLPPALILTAEFDPLRDEAERYAVRLEKAGIEARCVRYQGAIHGFFNFVGLLPQADAALEEATSFLHDVNQ